MPKDRGQWSPDRVPPAPRSTGSSSTPPPPKLSDLPEIGRSTVQCPTCGSRVTVHIHAGELDADGVLHVHPSYDHTCSLQGVPTPEPGVRTLGLLESDPPGADGRPMEYPDDPERREHGPRG